MTKDKTILVVDDEELLRNAIVFQFKREGFNVLSASNGTEAFEIIRTNKIDAVVSDVQMPGGNGIDLLKAVKEFNANIPVLVFITAFADITESEAYDLGASAIFTKPFDRKALVNCIKSSVIHGGRSWKAEISPEIVTDKTFHSSSEVTVGSGGAFIQDDSAQFKAGEMIALDLQAQFGSKVVNLRGVGKVRWTRSPGSSLPSGVGVEFLSLVPECKPEYDEWLDQNKIKPYIPLKAG